MITLKAGTRVKNLATEVEWLLSQTRSAHSTSVRFVYQLETGEVVTVVGGVAWPNERATFEVGDLVSVPGGANLLGEVIKKGEEQVHVALYSQGLTDPQSYHWSGQAIERIVEDAVYRVQLPQANSEMMKGGELRKYRANAVKVLAGPFPSYRQAYDAARHSLTQ